MSHIHLPYIQGFAPIADLNARILILGSMPGEESLRAGQYYAYRHNAFWKVMGDLVGADLGLPYESRTQLLKANGIALWDVIASCKRATSLDSAIDVTSIAANDFKTFFSNHPAITHVFFNGAMAEKCFHKYVQDLPPSRSLQYRRLPSTSPAHASMSYNQKLEAWKVIMQKNCK